MKAHLLRQVCFFVSSVNCKFVFIVLLMEHNERPSGVVILPMKGIRIATSV